MGGFVRLVHPRYFTRYFWGFWGTLITVNFLGEQQYGVDRRRNSDIQWEWWLNIQAKKAAGEIPMKTPGYMLAAYRNGPEERWAAAREEEGLDEEGGEEDHGGHGHH